MINNGSNEGGSLSKMFREEPRKNLSVTKNVKMKHTCKLCGSGLIKKWLFDRHKTTIHDNKNV